MPSPVFGGNYHNVHLLPLVTYLLGIFCKFEVDLLGYTKLLEAEMWEVVDIGEPKGCMEGELNLTEKDKSRDYLFDSYT